jgi:hypothetical protein
MDLSFLKEEEKIKILSVIEKDEQLRKQHEQKLG